MTDTSTLALTARLGSLPAAIACLLTSCCTPALAQAPDAASLAQTYQAEVLPLLESYCLDCHGAAEAVEGDVNLAALAAWDDAASDSATWQLVAEMLRNELMPPADAAQPTAEEHAKLLAWLKDYLALKAREHAGDPGRVILRRLSNKEYAYTLRDLTGIESLDPAREFPADGAAGEGFSNTGAALVMSPELVTKYLDAAKEVAQHAILVPDGFRFSPHTTARDWTDELLAEIRALYRESTDEGGGSQVNLQGIVLDTNQGGVLPVEKYLAATIAEREALTAGRKTIAEAAREHGLNAKYLGILWASLTSEEPSLLLDQLRSRWREAKPEDAAALAADVAAWQQALWTFSSVGLIGRVGGPKGWMEPVTPLTTSHELRLKIPESADGADVTVSLVAAAAGDGNEHDFVVWNSPRLTSPGQPDLLLRDVRRVAGELAVRRVRLFSQTAAFLAAANEALASENVDVAQLAPKHGVNEAELRAWLDFLGIRWGAPAKIEGLYTAKLTGVGGHAFANGWGSDATPLLIANASDQAVRIPGHLKPHGVVIHPSTTQRAAIGWQSPVAATVRIDGTVAHAHPECGNGVTWALELRRSASRQPLADGAAQGAAEVRIERQEGVEVAAGDVIVLSVGPRDGEHSCDLTAVDLAIAEVGGDARTWDLSADVSDDVHAGNPHADGYGNGGVWNFFTEAESGVAAGSTIPAESLLAKWRAAKSAEERAALAIEVEKLLTGGPPTPADSPDAVLYRRLAASNGPLLGGEPAPTTSAAADESLDATAANVGLDPAAFGRHPDGRAIAAENICVQAPAVLEIRLPADLATGRELVTVGTLDQESGAEGSVQLAVVAGTAAAEAGLRRGENAVAAEVGVSWSSHKQVANSAPILVAEGSVAQQRVQAAFDDHRQLFPPALCYTKIVPVDEVISTMLFYREDEHLQRLMLDDAQRERLDRLWNELHFVSRDALTSVDAFAQLLEFASQDSDPKAFEPMRQPIHERAEAFRRQLVECEPQQLDALVAFAARAYRRPLSAEEQRELRGLYQTLRQEELPHEEAFRLTLARLLAGPAFLYRIEQPVPGAEQGPVSDWELASRLSYFLWASQPDDELLALAAANRLHEPDVLVAQMRRLLADDKTRRLATEFACHWLHINDFERLDEKSERHFPTFAALRGAMAEESILFFTDLFQHDGSVLDLLDADHTFLNEELARHYGIPDVVGPEWRRVEGVQQYSRGGILGLATTLSKQSGASRTSPILRGNWVSEVLLGERMPKPPPGVPPLPDDEAATDGLTVRELVEKHVSDPSCAICHRRFDPYGFSLEAFDAIGRYREIDLGDRPINAKVTAMDGSEIDGMAGLRDYLLTKRRDAFTRQFCRKLLGYALGRTVQLSDDPLLAQMQQALAARDYRIDAAVETIVLSPQFREIRGMDAAFDE